MTGDAVEDGQLVEIVVLEAPGLKRPVRLDAAATEVASLEATSKPFVRLRVDGHEMVVEQAKFNKLFKGQDVEDVLHRAERADAPAVSRRAARKPSGAAGGTRGELQAVREWARGNGYEVGDRGRISEEIRSAYASR